MLKTKHGKKHRKKKRGVRGRSLAEMKLENSLKKTGLNFAISKKVWTQGGSFKVDFLIEKKIIVECEGIVHQQQIQWDEVRQKLLEDAGHKVLRFTNIEVFNSLSYCVERIIKAVKQLPSAAPKNSSDVADGIQD